MLTMVNVYTYRKVGEFIIPMQVDWEDYIESDAYMTVIVNRIEDFYDDKLYLLFLCPYFDEHCEVALCRMEKVDHEEVEKCVRDSKIIKLLEDRYNIVIRNISTALGDVDIS